MKLKQRLTKERGAAMVEYTPILALFILIALPSINLMGQGIHQKLCEIQKDSSVFSTNATNNRNCTDRFITLFPPESDLY